jgi:hypothetical protein
MPVGLCQAVKSPQGLFTVRAQPPPQAGAALADRQSRIRGAHLIALCEVS